MTEERFLPDPGLSFSPVRPSQALTNQSCTGSATARLRTGYDGYPDDRYRRRSQGRTPDAYYS